MIKVVIVTTIIPFVKYNPPISSAALSPKSSFNWRGVLKFPWEYAKEYTEEHSAKAKTWGFLRSIEKTLPTSALSSSDAASTSRLLGLVSSTKKITKSKVNNIAIVNYWLQQEAKKH